MIKVYAIIIVIGLLGGVAYGAKYYYDTPQNTIAQLLNAIFGHVRFVAVLQNIPHDFFLGQQDEEVVREFLDDRINAKNPFQHPDHLVAFQGVFT